MYYKVIGNGTVLDVLKQPQYVTYQERNNIILLCQRDEARGVLSSDSSTVWHVAGRKEIPFSDIISVHLVGIDEEEYEILKSAIGSEETPPQVDNQPVVEPSEVTLEYVKEKKTEKMKAACKEAIIRGVDVIFSDGKSHHFDLTIEDQINLIELKELINAGATEIPYHESGCLCKMYNPEDITLLLGAASAHKDYHITYFNSLRGYIYSLKEIDSVNNVYYGMLIPEDHWSEVLLAIMEGKQA